MTTSLQPYAGKAWQQRLRETLLLWLMDAVNILSSYLSMPKAAGLPLPPLMSAVARRAPAVYLVLDKVLDGLSRHDAHAAYEQGLEALHTATAH